MKTPPTAQAMVFADTDHDEELQRAELYGLLAQLWFAPPDEALLEQFSVAVTAAPEPGSFLESPWQDLVAAMRATRVDEAAAEYAALFVGAGKADVLPYASFQIAGTLNDRPLVALRTDLAALGLASAAPEGETEDHVSFVLEVMRYLIAGDDGAVCNLEQQRRFFRMHVQPWVGVSLCDAVEQHPAAGVYAALARFTRAFVEVETQAFDLVE
ncbi:MAG: TorD/DmsD family molecular chaperone [Rubrivivax sp.]